MTISTNINIAALNLRLSNIEACAQNAPARTYEEAKRLTEWLGRLTSLILAESRAAGFPIDNCDGIRTVECILFHAIVSNKGNPCFVSAEGFGATMETDARERVIQQAMLDRDFLEQKR